MTGSDLDSGAAGRGLAIVVVTFGAHELLEANLARIDTAAIGAQVVIVDNFHSIAERVAIESVAQRHGWWFLPMPNNLGFGAAMNRGVDYAQRLGCRTFLLLNPDARADVEVIDSLRTACEADPMTMISPRVVRPNGLVWFRGSYLDERTGNVGAADDAGSGRRDAWLTAACLMIHRDLWQRLDGFDTDFFLYWEDVDLSRRCIEVGGRLSVRRDLVAVHDPGGTQESSGKSALYYYFNCRNRLVFAAKHLSRRAAMRWLLLTPSASKRILLRGGRRQLLESPALLWAAVRGSTAGAVLLVSTLVRGRSAHGRYTAADRSGSSGTPAGSSICRADQS